MAARQHYSASNAGPVNNTSNSTWADIVQLPDFEPDASSTYAVFWSSALQNATNASADAQLRVRFGPAGLETTVATLSLESSATTEYPQIAGMFFHVEGTTPIDVYAEVSFKAETNGNNINAKNGQIVALKLGANDVAAESPTRQTSVSTTLVNAVTANFTSDGGDYVIVGYGEFDLSAVTVPAYMRLVCDGVNTGEIGTRSGDTTNLFPGMMVYRFTSVAAGARSASFQFHSFNGSTTTGCTNARILVMRAADFDAIYGAQLSSDNVSTSADLTVLTTTNTMTANPHLLLGAWGTSSTTLSINITGQITEAGTDIAESIRRTYNASAVRQQNSAFASVRTPGAGSKTYTLDRVQSGAASITVGSGSGFVLLDLGASGGGPATYNEILTETGTAAQTATTAATFPNARSEAVTSADAQAAALVAPISLSEGVSSAAAQSAAVIHQPAIAETATSSESSTSAATFASAATEAVTGADTSGTAATWLSSRTDALAANDNAAGTAIFPASRSESLTAADDATGDVTGGAVVYDDVLSEGLTASASAVAFAAMPAVRSEGLTATAAQSASATLLSARSEAATAAEAAQGSVLLSLALSEGVASTASQIVAGVFNGSISEIAAANDDDVAGISADELLSEGATASDGYFVDGGERIETPSSRHLSGALINRELSGPTIPRHVEGSTQPRHLSGSTPSRSLTAVTVRRTAA